ncbi:hypothetical protein D0846_09325, partial [Bordetella avium]
AQNDIQITFSKLDVGSKQAKQKMARGELDGLTAMDLKRNRVGKIAPAGMASDHDGMSAALRAPVPDKAGPAGAGTVLRSSSPDVERSDMGRAEATLERPELYLRDAGLGPQRDVNRTEASPASVVTKTSSASGADVMGSSADEARAGPVHPTPAINLNLARNERHQDGTIVTQAAGAAAMPEARIVRRGGVAIAQNDSATQLVVLAHGGWKAKTREKTRFSRQKGDGYFSLPDTSRIDFYSQDGSVTAGKWVYDEVTKRPHSAKVGLEPVPPFTPEEVVQLSQSRDRPLEKVQALVEAWTVRRGESAQGGSHIKNYALYRHPEVDRKVLAQHHEGGRNPDIDLAIVTDPRHKVSLKHLLDVAHASHGPYEVVHFAACRTCRDSTDKYDRRSVVVMHDDPLVEQAARRLARKHPDNTDLMRRLPTGELQMLSQASAAKDGRVKVQLLGHGMRDDQGRPGLGGVDVEGVAATLLHLGVGSPKWPSAKVALVGCHTSDCGGLDEALRRQLQSQLLYAMPDIRGYASRIEVNEKGAKRRVQEGGLGNAAGKMKHQSVEGAAPRLVEGQGARKLHQNAHASLSQSGTAKQLLICAHGAYDPDESVQAEIMLPADTRMDFYAKEGDVSTALPRFLIPQYPLFAELGFPAITPDSRQYYRKKALQQHKSFGEILKQQGEAARRKEVAWGDLVKNYRLIPVATTEEHISSYHQHPPSKEVDLAVIRQGVTSARLSDIFELVEQAGHHYPIMHFVACRSCSSATPAQQQPLFEWAAPNTGPVRPLADKQDIYGQRLIIQHGNDDMTARAARRLFGKHPHNSTVVMQDEHEQLQLLRHGDKLSTGSVKIQLVGHGSEFRRQPILGGSDARELSDLTRQALQQLQVDPGRVAKVSLVGCNTADCASGSLAAEFAHAWVGSGEGTMPRIVGYAGQVDVDANGRKLQVQDGGLGGGWSCHRGQGCFAPHVDDDSDSDDDVDSSAQARGFRPFDPSVVKYESYSTKSGRRLLANDIAQISQSGSADQLIVSAHGLWVDYNPVVPNEYDGYTLAPSDMPVYFYSTDGVSTYDSVFSNLLRAPDLALQGMPAINFRDRTSIQNNALLARWSFGRFRDFLEKTSQRMEVITPGGLMKNYRLDPETTADLHLVHNGNAYPRFDIVTPLPQIDQKIVRFSDIVNFVAATGHSDQYAAMHMITCRNCFDGSGQLIHTGESIDSLQTVDSIATMSSLGSLLASPAEETPDRYGSRVILQVDADQQSDIAAGRLAGKHADNTVWMQLRPGDRLHTVYRGPQVASGPQKIQLVGHGGTYKGTPIIGGVNAREAAIYIREIKRHVAGSVLEKVTLVGCETAHCEGNDLRENLMKQLLNPIGASPQVQGYPGGVDVAPGGHKIPVLHGGLDFAQ